MTGIDPDVTLLGEQQHSGSGSATAPDPDPPVLVVHDHVLLSEALTIALRSRGVPAVRCPVTDAESVLAHATTMQPSVVLLDLELEGKSRDRPIDSAELAGALRADGWTVVAVTRHRKPDRIAAVVAAGAAAILWKSTPLAELLRVVAEVAAGNSMITYKERRRWLTLHRQLQADARQRANRLNRLTPRERQVLDLLAQGHRAAAIADALVVSLTTVRSQIRSILAKLEVKSQLEAVALARQNHPTVQ